MKAPLILSLLRAAGLSVALAATAVPPRAQSFALQAVSNRMITPNGDGRNDTLLISVANPSFADVTGKIYDLRGHFVSDMTASTASQVTSLLWDGRGGGTLVHTGVYIYVIENSGETIRGAVVVIR